jgi:hypothetical protein
VGEDLPGAVPIRDMLNPLSLGDPGKMSDAAFWCGDDYRSDRGGVHTNSGIPNHAFALMVDGGSYNGESVVGIGLTRAGKIQYRTLAYYLTSASDFLDNYNSLLQACEDLVGTAGITTSHCAEVQDALDAVEMSANWPCAPVQGQVPGLCPSSQAPDLWHYWDVESSGVTICPSNAVLDSWCQNAPSSLLGLFATSGTRSYWGYNRPTAGSMWVSVNPGASGLPEDARMQFNHAHGFENSGASFYDGGVVEYSTNQGATWNDGGPLIVAGQDYGGTLSTCCLNPLGGRGAFVADSWGYTATQLDLTSLGGESFLYRFNLGTDFTIDEYGWFVDDIRIFTCADCVTTRVLTSAYNGLAPQYSASTSIEAGAGFSVGAMETVTLRAPTVSLSSGFQATGELTIENAACSPD